MRGLAYDVAKPPRQDIGRNLVIVELPWYAELREKWRPERVRLLLMAESAPADDGDENRRRFFYLDRLSGADNLFRGTVEALY